MKLLIYKDTEEMSRKAAEAFISRAKAAIEERGRFYVALSGGSTPRALYTILSSGKFRNAIDWSKVFFFFGDERCVPPDSKDSNFRMARETLFLPLGVPEANIFRIKGEDEPESAAAEYENILKKFFTVESTFDLALLGLGPDSHTLSIFPGVKAVGFTGHFVAAYHIEELKSWRISLTYKAVNASLGVFFLVSGDAKAKALKMVLKGGQSVEECPAKGVRPVAGEISWFVDTDAARLLHGE